MQDKNTKKPKNAVKTPCYIIDEQQIIKNLQILRDVANRAGCKILLAQKAFSAFALYPLIGEYLDGTTASGLHEAQLSHDYMKNENSKKENPKKENHVFSVAYSDAEFAEILQICDYIIFNSFGQWERFKQQIKAHETATNSKKNYGIRINPEHSTQGGGIYDPCATGSRLGVTAKNFPFADFSGISNIENDEIGENDENGETPKITGLHFHTLCQQNSDALESTVKAFEEKFSQCFGKLKWVNFGGGHHITRPNYDTEKLISVIKNFRQKYNLAVYLEPGEAIALNAGVLVSTVLDIIENNGKIAILDTSATCHMPDVLEMPYRPEVTTAAPKGEKPHSYVFGGVTCLAGDIIGEYSFDQPLQIGDTVTFTDMAIYSMVKNNTFNGINLPSIALQRANGTLAVLREFGYQDFLGRLG
ncbi:MAG: carboxynorspermidine decarboxylase [Defluviitaleaceae bacterium]|nr:carboxynorspermidine decarboxylase [Defluviitaleaceae bacterium]